MRAFLLGDSECILERHPQHHNGLLPVIHLAAHAHPELGGRESQACELNALL